MRESGRYNAIAMRETVVIVATMLTGRRPHVRRICASIASLLVLGTACNEGTSVADRITAPDRRMSPPSASRCTAECTLAEDARPFRAAHVSRDSAGARVYLGEAVVRGAKGAVVAIELAADQDVVTALGDRAAVVVEVGGVAREFVLRSLAGSRVAVYRFDEASTVRIRYSLTRRVSDTIPAGAVRLTQYVTGGAVGEVHTPWVRKGPSGALAAASTGATPGSCSITGAVVTACGVQVTTNPFYTAIVIGGTFQSSPETGASVNDRILTRDTVGDRDDL